MARDFESELKSFSGVWKGGYYEGDPLVPVAHSFYEELGFVSVLHLAYMTCIKPYIKEDTVALEIGPGRGGWTKGMLAAKEIYALDALSAEHNGFYEYLGNPNHVKYFQVNDFECNELPENHFDYVFSFGCLCHVSFDGITKYAQNMFPKLKSGANCFWMIADYDKYNNTMKNLEQLSIFNHVLPRRKKYMPIQWLLNKISKTNDKFVPLDKNEHLDPFPMRWYHAGVDRTCAMLEEAGYKIVSRDMEVNMRDPIIHFIKP